MKFESAVDQWYYMLVAGVAITLLAALVPQLMSGQLPVFALASVFLVSLGFPLWLLFSTYYMVSDNLLLIKSGPFSWKIRLTDIHSAKLSRNMISSPALSLNRIELRYGRGKRVLVSPRDRSGFLRAIGQEK